MNVFLQKYAKAEGEAEEYHCENSSFISMLVRLFVICFFHVVCLFFSFICVLIRFLLTLHSRDQTQYGCTIVLHYLFVFAFVCSRRYIVRSFLPQWREILKATEAGTLSNGNKQLRCFSEMVSRVTV